MARLFKVELRDGTIMEIEAEPDDAESWLKKPCGTVRLHGSSYSVNDIACVTEIIA